MRTEGKEIWRWKLYLFIKNKWWKLVGVNGMITERNLYHHVYISVYILNLFLFPLFDSSVSFKDQKALDFCFLSKSFYKHSGNWLSSVALVLPQDWSLYSIVDNRSSLVSATITVCGHYSIVLFSVIILSIATSKQSLNWSSNCYRFMCGPQQINKKIKEQKWKWNTL